MPKTTSNYIVLAIQAVLGVEIFTGVLTQNLAAIFVASVTLGLTFLPSRFARFFGVSLPRTVLASIVVFIFATLFLGEVGDFYEKFWWWDVVLHFMSALSFGAMGFLLIFMLFEGDRYAAPAWALATLAFCVGMSLGGLWEIFEYSMDSLFGMNMQKSGLDDTMQDLIVDAIGAAIGAFSGYLYLKGRQLGGLGKILEEFVQANARFYRKTPKK
ncbi:hypothetical protein L0666_04330 [Octadecabacter sp. CECT 8868]|uniref:hypothetical protein n=1 Tax=Octadecabacter algicola TaxID=2909342 RepID=UPI001F3AEB7A|nr:hypothetical protein [Octadecabacter algicola]MCF2904205.1 hypothetical protein [Octadecabacter algicola]